VRTVRNTEIHINSVRTSKDTHYVSTTEPNRLMLYGETVAVYCETRTEHIDAPYGQNVGFSVLMRVVHTTGLYRVIRAASARLSDEISDPMGLHPAGWPRDNIADLHARSVRFESRPSRLMLLWFSSIFRGKCRDKVNITSLQFSILLTARRCQCRQRLMRR
jgi:hypothetical protein